MSQYVNHINVSNTELVFSVSLYLIYQLFQYKASYTYEKIISITCVGVTEVHG